MRFSKKGKFIAWYIGSFEIVECLGIMAYRLALPSSSFGVHLVFHMSMLKNYHRDGDYIIKWGSILLEKNLQYEKKLITVPDWGVQKLRTKEIRFIKVQWKHLKNQLEKSKRICETNQLFSNLGTILFLPYTSFSNLITQGWVINKLVSLIMTWPRCYGYINGEENWARRILSKQGKFSDVLRVNL